MSENFNNQDSMHTNNMDSHMVMQGIKLKRLHKYLHIPHWWTDMWPLNMSNMCGWGMGVAHAAIVT